VQLSSHNSTLQDIITVPLGRVRTPTASGGAATAIAAAASQPTRRSVSGYTPARQAKLHDILVRHKRSELGSNPTFVARKAVDKWISFVEKRRMERSWTTLGPEGGIKATLKRVKEEEKRLKTEAMSQGK
jgi:hypothetical protein